MDRFTSRKEFRAVLSSVVHGTRSSLEEPRISPFTPEELFRWFQQITLEDVQAIFAEWEEENRSSGA